MTSRSSSPTHSIKLKGPWAVTFLPADESLTDSPASRTVPLPAEWRDLFGEIAGRAVFERRFNRPTGLTGRHRVHVHVRGVTGALRVRLNDEPLPVEREGIDLHVIEITDRMQPHNRLSVEIEYDPCDNPHLPGGLWQPVVLQIQGPA